MSTTRTPIMAIASSSSINRIASDISLASIDEENASVVLISPEEKATMHSTSLSMDHHTFSPVNDQKPNKNEKYMLWKGKIFESIQMLRHFSDSKTFVDHVLKTNDLYTVRQHFAKHILSNCNAISISPKMLKSSSSKSVKDIKAMTDSKVIGMTKSRASYHNGFEIKYHSKLDEFIKSYFFNPGFEILHGQTPSDWNECPKSDLFEKILIAQDTNDANTTKMRQFAFELNNLWKILYRELTDNVSAQPFRYSFISLKHAQIFVPGGRFREVYYWDSLWIVEGLICCNMVCSAIRLVENLCDLVVRFGFVPNGTRKYYMDRSQPPLLTLMVMAIYQRTKDIKWLKAMLPALSKEYKYWTNEPVQVLIKNKKYKLARYYSTEYTPRPESFYEDRMTAMLEEDETKHSEIYQQIRASAASGWDFSSRWVYDKNGPLQACDADAFCMNKMDTLHVIPVDLNVFLCKVEGCLAAFYNDIGDKNECKKYKNHQNERIVAILDVLWDAKNGQFRDWNFNFECFGALNIASNFSPLWLQCDNVRFNENKSLLVDALKKSKLVCRGGIATTLCQSGEQWDYPNCWAPLQMMIIEGLYHMEEEKYIKYARKLANIWLNNNYYTFVSTNKMHEKYHCERYSGGGGGEYKPQFGFGWTNGACLKLMELFGSDINLNECPILN